MKAIKSHKNQRGITLIELLAVIVILGIIAAIAVPAIGNMIENSKKDAHIGNARAMVEATRLLSISESNIMPSEGRRTFVPLGYLINVGYLDEIDSPGYERYAQTKEHIPAFDDHANNKWADGQDSFVVIDNNNGTIEYYVKLITYNNKVILPLTKVNDITREDITIQ
ncbi:type IV pilus assembly protein PilA [Ureibacillus xyleni]|uniref:Type IV pilus assembly protein PilA n=1 Tax=Ureibacillus xyleni TaxID=614648 RepID=A0A285T272_9BACL|nr:prepilin-type N-terminal cleavage/methylation domain-containing protein [Ureibacillus xyleni]SOC13285.1 type IV pilus assembly protein PilA [Ureibacillus xyleni]